mgnify:CR=1 FL=1
MGQTHGAPIVLVGPVHPLRGGYGLMAERVAVHQADPEVAARVFDVNLKGTYFMCHAFGRLLVEQARGGAIVNVTSIAGKRMAPRNAAYGTSKAALHALTDEEESQGNSTTDVHRWAQMRFRTTSLF